MKINNKYLLILFFILASCEKIEPTSIPVNSAESKLNRYLKPIKKTCNQIETKATNLPQKECDAKLIALEGMGNTLNDDELKLALSRTVHCKRSHMSNKPYKNTKELDRAFLAGMNAVLESKRK